MSSLIRTLQKRIMANKNRDKIPVLNPFAKNVVIGHIYPYVPGMLAVTYQGVRIFSAHDPILDSRTKPIVELMENDR
jgi:hypothetical protein